MVTDRRWKQLVSEGRSLVLGGAKARLELGRIAQEIEPKGSAHGGDRSGASTPVRELERYGDEVDVDASVLRDYRNVLVRWGGDPTRIPEAGWTVLREIADMPGDPFENYRTIGRDHGRVDTVTVRIARGTPGWNHQQETPVASKAAQARHLLSDPEVVRETLKDPATARALVSAERERVGR